MLSGVPQEEEEEEEEEDIYLAQGSVPYILIHKSSFSRILFEYRNFRYRSKALFVAVTVLSRWIHI